MAPIDDRQRNKLFGANPLGVGGEGKEFNVDSEILAHGVEQLDPAVAEYSK
jgi:hypothetical protein